MEQSRVKRYKEYRKALTDNGDDVLMTQSIDINKDINDERLKKREINRSSLSTLSVSYDQIMSATKDAEIQNVANQKRIRRAKLLRFLKIVGLVIGCLILLAAIVTAGIFVFR